MVVRGDRDRANKKKRGGVEGKKLENARLGRDEVDKISHVLHVKCVKCNYNVYYQCVLRIARGWIWR